MQNRRTPGIISILVLVVSCLFLSGCVESEYVIDPESLKTWEIFNSKNGLGSDSVWTMTEDIEGNIWIGTVNNGVSKFDGKTWTNYNEDNGLINNWVRSIAQDGYGDMWFGTDEGLCILSGNKWTYYAPEFGSVDAILRDYYDNMWVSSYNYPVLEYKNNEWHSFYDDTCYLCNIVPVIFEDNERNIWIGSLGDLKKITKNTTISYTKGDGVSLQQISSIHQDIWGNIWIAVGYWPLVIKYNNEKFEKVSLLSLGLSSSGVNTITSDNKGNVWFGTSGDGAIKYNGSIMEPYTLKNGLPGKSIIMKILKDKHGYLWFGSLNGGVAKYNPWLD
jgi:ligand-binding sensor domain-containing protein